MILLLTESEIIGQYDQTIGMGTYYNCRAKCHRENLPGREMIMGCFEDYMDFLEEVDRIKKKDRAKEEPKGFLCLADPKTDGICPSGRSLPP